MDLYLDNVWCFCPDRALGLRRWEAFCRPLSALGRHEFRNPHEVVGCGRAVGIELGLPAPDEASLSQAGDGFQPAEDLVGSASDALARLVSFGAASVAGFAPGDGFGAEGADGAAARSHMRRHLAFVLQLVQERAVVVAFVGAERLGPHPMALAKPPEHAQGAAPFGFPVGAVEVHVHDQSAAKAWRIRRSSASTRALTARNG